MTKACAFALLFCLPLGCRTSNPPPAPQPYIGAYSAGEGVTLRIGSDGSIQALDKLVYDPAKDNESEFKEFLATEREKDPHLSVNLLAAPGVSMEMVERASKLAGEDMRNRGRITLKIEGSVQSSLRWH